MDYNGMTLVANGMMSDKHDVISGVPQGMVLASLFFIIMIADIDENLKISISRLFADDTKVDSPASRPVSISTRA